MSTLGGSVKTGFSLIFHPPLYPRSCGTGHLGLLAIPWDCSEHLLCLRLCALLSSSYPSPPPPPQSTQWTPTHSAQPSSIIPPPLCFCLTLPGKVNLSLYSTVLEHISGWVRISHTALSPQLDCEHLRKGDLPCSVSLVLGTWKAVSKTC